MKSEGESQVEESARSRSWSGNLDRYGNVGEFGVYRLALESYYWDRLEESYREIGSIGTGSNAIGVHLFRMIEAEYQTREIGEITKFRDWLDLEVVPQEIHDGVAEIGGAFEQAADDVAKRLGWEHSAPVLMTVFTEGANAPWTPGRHGFCVDKYPYDKICLPRYLLNNHSAFMEASRHEYTHVINLNVTQGKCPTWLDEGIAMTMGGTLDRRAVEGFARGHFPWLPPHQLSQAFRGDRENPNSQRVVWRAYQQSALIAQYLVSMKGEPALGELLRAFSNNSLWTDMKLLVSGQEPVEEALQEVYSMNSATVFDNALEFIS